MSQRTITINEVKYLYVIGESYARITNAVTGKSKSVPLTELIGMDWNNIERGRWKRTLQVGPGDIARYIRENSDGI